MKFGKDVNIWLMVAVLVVGVLLTAIFYFFSGAKRSFSHGHIFILVTYVGFVFVLIADYAKRVDLVPRLYKERLKDDKQLCQEKDMIECRNFDCLEHIENTYEFHYFDNTYSDDGCKRRDYIDWNVNANDVMKCYHTPEVGESSTSTTPSKLRKMYTLYVRDFFIKAAFNCCASDNFRNGYVNIESMNLAIRMGCRFLDFEVYTIDGAPCVATSTNPHNYNYKESFNHLDLDYVLKHAQEKAMTVRGCKNYTDPLFLHFRVKTRVAKTYVLMARCIQKYFGTTLIGPDFAIDFTRDESPFSLPLESTLGRVFVIFNNDAGSDYFPEGALFNQYIYRQMGRDAKELRSVVTTWSGTHNNVATPDHGLREHLRIVEAPETNTEVVSVRDKTNQNDGAEEELKTMFMYRSVQETDGVTPDEYSVVNKDLLDKGFFSTNTSKEKTPVIQIVPVCVQAYQKECKGSVSLLVQWFRFFTSSVYSIYSPYDEDTTLRGTGMRQRMVKWHEHVVQSDITIGANVNTKSKGLDQLVEKVKTLSKKDAIETPTIDTSSGPG